VFVKFEKNSLDAKATDLKMFILKKLYKEEIAVLQAKKILFQC
jgi:hypothetical protein